MEANNLIKFSNRADLAALGSHLICCGVPAFVTIVSLISSTAAAGTSLLGRLSLWAESLHTGAFIFSSVMVVVALISFAIAYKRDCSAAGECCHEPCKPKKTANGKRLALSLVLYAANLGVFLLG